MVPAPLTFGVFFFNFFLFMIVTEREREREAETQAEGEAGSMHWEPDVGFDPGSPGSRPGPKAGAKPLRHPGIPHFFIIVFIFGGVEFDKFFIDFDTIPLSDKTFTIIFSHSTGCLLVLLFPLLCQSFL